MAAARLAELAWSRHNLRSAGTAGEGPWSRRTYPGIVAVHALTLLITAVAGSRRPSWPWLMLLLAVQPLRAWVLLSLGNRWNARGAVPEDLEVVVSGPYRFIRHPNYAVVAVELLAPPMAFRLPRLALGASLANAALLAVRIPEEESALASRPGYAALASRRRFIPGVF